MSGAPSPKRRGRPRKSEDAPKSTPALLRAAPTPKTQAKTSRWEPKKLTVLSCVPGAENDAPMIDTDGLLKQRVIVHSVEEAALEISYEQRLHDKIQVILLALNRVLCEMANQRKEMEQSMDAGTLLALRKSNGDIFKALELAANDPTDFTLPWPPFGLVVMNRHRELVLKAMEEVEASCDAACQALAPTLAKKQGKHSGANSIPITPPQTPLTMSDIAPLVWGLVTGKALPNRSDCVPTTGMVTGVPILTTPIVCRGVPRSPDPNLLPSDSAANAVLRSQLVKNHFSEHSETTHEELILLERIQTLLCEQLPIPPHLPAYPEPYAITPKSLSTDLGEASLDLLLKGEWKLAAQKFLTESQMILDEESSSLAFAHSVDFPES